MAKATMRDYISREEALRAFENADADVMEDYGDGTSNWGFGMKNIQKVIDGIPAAEVRAVRRGYWREDALNFSNGNYELECPFCECQMALNGCSKNQEYCPHCGEKLDFMRW